MLEYFISSQRRPEGHGRYRPAYRRLGLPDPPSGGRVPGGHHPGGRLRHRRRHRGQRDRGGTARSSRPSPSASTAAIPPPISRTPQTGEVLFTKDTMLRKDDAEILEKHGIHAVKIRSVLTCRARSGVCRQVLRHTTLPSASPWAPVRRWASSPPSSIGEPGTQLTIAYLPHRRRGRRRHHPGSAPSGGAV